MAIPSEDVLFQALNHEIRREILRLLHTTPRSFSDLLNRFAISTGKLDYHLKLLLGFITKTETGLYQITPLGQHTLQLLTEFNQRLTDQEQPLLKQAYIAQLKETHSFLHIRLVGGLYFKIIVLTVTLIIMGVTTISYIQAGVDIWLIWPLYLIIIVLVIAGGYWIYRQYGPAKEFVQRVDSLLEKTK